MYKIKIINIPKQNISSSERIVNEVIQHMESIADLKVYEGQSLIIYTIVYKSNVGKCHDRSVKVKTKKA